MLEQQSKALSLIYRKQSGMRLAPNQKSRAVDGYWPKALESCVHLENILTLIENIQDGLKNQLL